VAPTGPGLDPEIRENPISVTQYGVGRQVRERDSMHKSYVVLFGFWIRMGDPSTLPRNQPLHSGDAAKLSASCISVVDSGSQAILLFTSKLKTVDCNLIFRQCL